MPHQDHEIPFERLPEKFAQSLENPPAVPATPRPAATIVLMRDGSDGLEVLLLRRNRSAGFVPGAYVFPGGRVDRSDGAAELVERVSGLSEERAAARMGVTSSGGPDDGPTAIAFYLAALREAFEETGILVGRDAAGTHPPAAAASQEVDALRDDLMEDRIAFAAVLDSLGCTVAGDEVEYLAHWITPEAEPRRYDTHFFAAKVPAGAMPIIDPREMTDAVWITPAEALRRNDDGTLPMVFPTLKTLEQLDEYETVDEALADLAARTVRTILPTLVVTPTGVALRVDDEDEA